MKASHLLQVSGLALALGMGTLAQADVVNLSAVADAHLRGGWASDTNYGNQEPLYVSSVTDPTSSDTVRAIFKFDLTTVEDVVNSATLALTRGTGTGTVTFTVHLVTGDGAQEWVENQATFNIYKTGSSWTTPGGDFDPTPIGSDSVPIVTATNIDVTDAVQAMKDAGNTYVSFIVFGQATNASTDHIYSRSNGDESRRPVLTVDSQPIPEPGSLALLGLGGVLVLARRRSSNA